MLTPQDIAIRATRAYLPFVRSWLEGQAFIPVSFPAGAPPTDYHTLRDAVAKLLNGAKGPRSYGYRVEQELRQTRNHGAQSLPARIIIDTPNDLLCLAGKTAEFAAFCADAALIRAALPQLEHWLRDNPQHVIAQHGAWPELLRVCQYFLAYPRPDLYIRELPIDVHTKFIETHAGILRRLLDTLLPQTAFFPEESQFERRYGLRSREPLVRIRILDSALQLDWDIPFSELAVPVSQLAAFHVGALRCLITENELTFLTLPPLPNTIAIWGGGFRVEILKNVPWLHKCEIWYWGDLDAQGFQILSQLRSFLPYVASFLMDQATFEAFKEFVVVGTPTNVTMLPYLTEQEQALFQHLAHSQQRLEQERITQRYMLEQIQRLG